MGQPGCLMATGPECEKLCITVGNQILAALSIRKCQSGAPCHSSQLIGVSSMNHGCSPQGRVTGH